MPRPALAALLVILPVTLGLRSVEQVDSIPDNRRLAADARASLAGNGWSVRPLKHHMMGWLIEGERRDCRILVHFTRPEGDSDGKFKSLARPIGPVSYQYRGHTSRDFPRFIPMLAAHVQRYAWSFGLAIPTPPLVAIAQSPSCSAQGPDFSGLRQHLSVARPTKGFSALE